MPRYVYRCTACDHEYDQRQSFGASPEGECPECSAFPADLPCGSRDLQGIGFYTTDYARKK